MMSRKFKKFIIFNRNQQNSDFAAYDLDGGLMCGYPILVGDHYMIVLSTGFTRASDEEAAKEQITNAKKILDKYNLKYRICVFKD